MMIEKGHTMKISQRVIRLLGLFGLWLGIGLQVHAQTDTVTYVYTDPQGTPLVKADASGNVIARYDYTPYGNSVTSLGSPPDGPGYTGHVNDPETGLVYMQARYYQPMGRFLSPDPVAPDPGRLFGFNRYDYANNNPIVKIDPDGRQEVDGEAIDEDAYKQRQANLLGPPLTYQPPSAIESALEKVSDAELEELVHPGAAAEKFNKATDEILKVSQKIPNSDLKDPPAKRGNAPIGSDGHSIELHHVDQTPEGEVVEMTRTDHRVGENFKNNHPNTGQQPSNIDRSDWKQQQRNYWKSEWDRGRFDDMHNGGS